jgi:hypothetical protein
VIVRNPRPRKPEQSAVEMALAAIEGRPSPLDDADMETVNPDPSSLDLPEEYEEMCSPRRTHPAADACIICGQPLCDDCVGLAD